MRQETGQHTLNHLLQQKENRKQSGLNIEVAENAINKLQVLARAETLLWGRGGSRADHWKET